MTLTKKVMAWSLAGILAITCFMIFNEAPDTVHYNVIALIYILGMIKYAGKILPKWMVDYFNH